MTYTGRIVGLSSTRTLYKEGIITDSQALRRTITLLTDILLTNTVTNPTRDQLQRLVRLCGSDQTLTWLAQTQAIVASEGSGGAAIAPLGELFMQIVADDLWQTTDLLPYRLIFELSTSVPVLPSSPPWPTTDLWVSIQQIQPGKITTMDVTLIGMPAQVVTRPTLTVVRLESSNTPPRLPAGVPVPQNMPPTTYLVIVSAAQWRRVAVAVRRGDDPLIIQGWQYYDPAQQAIMVLTQQLTTQRQQETQDQFYQHLIQQRDRPDKPS